MTRREHNARWNAARQMTERVLCSTIGYGELSQYDPLCASCWLGQSHIWVDHDRMVLAAREASRDAEERAARVAEMARAGAVS